MYDKNNNIIMNHSNGSIVNVDENDIEDFADFAEYYRLDDDEDEIQELIAEIDSLIIDIDNEKKELDDYLINGGLLPRRYSSWIVRIIDCNSNIQKHRAKIISKILGGDNEN